MEQNIDTEAEKALYKASKLELHRQRKELQHQAHSLGERIKGSPPVDETSDVISGMKPNRPSGKVFEMPRPEADQEPLSQRPAA